MSKSFKQNRDQRVKENYAKNQTDRYIVSADITVFVGYFFVFQTPSSEKDNVRILLVIALAALIINFVLTLWYLHRQPIRFSRMLNLSEKTIDTYVKKIGLTVEELVLPTARMQGRIQVEEIAKKAENEQEFKLMLQKRKESIGSDGDEEYPRFKEAQGYVVEALLFQMAQDSKEDHKKAFHDTLPEKYPNMKRIIDIASFRLRRYFLISAGTLMGISLFIRLLGV